MRRLLRHVRTAATIGFRLARTMKNDPKYGERVAKRIQRSAREVIEFAETFQLDAEGGRLAENCQHHADGQPEVDRNNRTTVDFERQKSAEPDAIGSKWTQRRNPAPLDFFYSDSLESPDFHESQAKHSFKYNYYCDKD